MDGKPFSGLSALSGANRARKPCRRESVAPCGDSTPEPAKPLPTVADRCRRISRRTQRAFRAQRQSAPTGRVKRRRARHEARGTGHGKRSPRPLASACHWPSETSARSAQSRACAAKARGRGPTRPVPVTQATPRPARQGCRQAAGPVGAGRPPGITAPPAPRADCGRGPARRRCWPLAPTRPRPWPASGSRRCGQPRGP